MTKTGGDFDKKPGGDSLLERKPVGGGKKFKQKSTGNQEARRGTRGKRTGEMQLGLNWGNSNEKIDWAGRTGGERKGAGRAKGKTEVRIGKSRGARQSH